MPRAASCWRARRCSSPPGRGAGWRRATARPAARTPMPCRCWPRSSAAARSAGSIASSRSSAASPPIPARPTAPSARPDRLRHLRARPRPGGTIEEIEAAVEEVVAELLKSGRDRAGGGAGQAASFRTAAVLARDICETGAPADRRGADGRAATSRSRGLARAHRRGHRGAGQRRGARAVPRRGDRSPPSCGPKPTS